VNGAVAWIQDPDHSRTHALQVSGGVISRRTSLYSQFTVVDYKGNEHIGPTMENGNLVAANVGIHHTF
jgi:hypothetical protein